MATLKPVKSDHFGGGLNKSNPQAALSPAESPDLSGGMMPSGTEAKLDRIAAALEDIAGSLKIAFPS
jgi:hypothetical protein